MSTIKLTFHYSGKKASTYHHSAFKSPDNHMAYLLDTNDPHAQMWVDVQDYRDGLVFAGVGVDKLPGEFIAEDVAAYGRGPAAPECSSVWYAANRARDLTQRGPEGAWGRYLGRLESGLLKLLGGAQSW